MSASAFVDGASRRRGGAVSPLPYDTRHQQRVEEASHSGRGLPLFVTPSRDGGFRASIRGHLLELADPSDGDLAPSPDDLRTVSVAADVAWLARRFLRDRGLDDRVSVTAWRWASDGAPGVNAVDITVTVSDASVPVRAMLTTALECEFADTFRPGRVRFQVSDE